MDMAGVDLSGMDRMMVRVGGLEDALTEDIPELMVQWENILVDTNRDGLLRGLDCHDQPMATTWREKHPTDQWMPVKPHRAKAGGKGIKAFLAQGSASAGTGGPMVPKGPMSRAIRNAVTAHGRSGPADWFAALGWLNFETDNGLEILELHANPPGDVRFPRRDLISRLRPSAIERAHEALRWWLTTRVQGTL